MRNKRLYFNISELNFLLLLAGFFSCGLVFIRVFWTLSPDYLSLIWNLFLAWIPYIFSYLLRKKNIGIKRKSVLYSWIIIWVLFFPNAPYIITDLFHLNERPGMPVWYDLILIISFALNGLILGFLSLKDMQYVVSFRTNKKRGWLFAVVVLFLSGFGVYLGRYLRWNSWDVFTQTNLLANDLWNIVSNPLNNARAYGFTLLFSAFQLLMYYSLQRFVVLLRKETTFF